MLPIGGCSARSTAAASARTLPQSKGLLSRRPCTSLSFFFFPASASHAIGPTRLLRESTVATASGSQASPPTITTTTTSSSRPLTDTEIHFYDTFLLSSEDVHVLLLQEAHRKHGVWMTVPPQLAPTVPGVGPPAIPEPLYPQKQRERLDALALAAEALRRAKGAQRAIADKLQALPHEDCLAYAPTHQPPPFVTTGTRALWVGSSTEVGELRGVAGSSAPSSPSSANVVSAMAAAGTGEGSTSLSQVQTTVTEVAVRAPVETSMQFHCGCCGRAFRRREAAEEHVQLRHNSSSTDAKEAKAEVVAGAGPGEIVGYKTVVGATVSTSAATSAATATTAAAPTQPASIKGLSSAAVGVAAAAAAVSESAKDTPPTTSLSADWPSNKAASSAFVSSVAKAPQRQPLSGAQLYGATPAVTLPEEDLVDELLASVWDDVALHRSDIEKAAGVGAATVQAGNVDSCHGRFFIPSTAFVEGKADNRAELEAEMANKPLARATPEGAAPGVRRTTTTNQFSTGVLSRRLYLQQRGADGSISLTEGDGAGASAAAAATAATTVAPTAQQMSIAQLSRHYPNPFGDSPNAALAELEKEPVNPFRDLEGEEGSPDCATTSTTARTHDAAEKVPSDGSATSEGLASAAVFAAWRSRFAARPYACPLCQRRALPHLAAVVGSPVSPLTGHDPASPLTAAVAAKTKTTQRSPNLSGTRAQSVAPGGGTCDASVVDEEAWCWYAKEVPRFRLLDALEDHLDTCHSSSSGAPLPQTHEGEDACVGEGEVTDEDWQRLYSMEASPVQTAESELAAVRRAYRAKVNAATAALAASATHAMSNAVAEGGGCETSCMEVGGTRTTVGNDGRHTSASADEDAELSSTDAAQEVLAVAAPPHVHVRSAVNTVLVGTVRDVQDGYVGATRVMQYVLALRNGEANAAVDEADAAAAGPRDVRDGEELVVVRCIGDLVPVALLIQQVHIGSTLFVAGTLRMNRNVDTTSRRSHAYPYIQVVPPLGSVRVVK